jgi:hypothetical protein
VDFAWLRYHETVECFHVHAGLQCAREMAQGVQLARCIGSSDNRLHLRRQFFVAYAKPGSSARKFDPGTLCFEIKATTQPVMLPP